MDLKTYYRKIREAESTIADAFVVMCSLETPDGGKAGRMAEVARAVAARLLTEGRSRLATAEETAAFYAAQQQAREEAEATASALRMQVMVVPQAELKPKPVKK